MPKLVFGEKLINLGEVNNIFSEHENALKTLKRAFHSSLVVMTIATGKVDKRQALQAVWYKLDLQW